MNQAQHDIPASLGATKSRMYVIYAQPSHQTPRRKVIDAIHRVLVSAAVFTNSSYLLLINSMSSSKYPDLTKGEAATYVI